MENKIFYKIKFLLFISIFLSGNLILQSQSKITKTASERINNIYGNTNFLSNYHNNSSLNSRNFFTEQKLKTYLNIRKGINSILFESASAINSNSHSFNKRNNSSTVVERVEGTDYLGTDFKMIYDYDNRGYIINKLEKKYDGSQFVNYEQTTYEFDSFGNQTLRLRETWDGSMWVGNDRLSNSFDAAGNELMELSESWIGGMWVGVTRITHSYDAAGNEIEVLDEKWDGSSWTNDSRETNTYEADGSQVQINENWDGSSWTKESRASVTLNSDGSIVYLYDEWDGNDWVQSRRETTLFNSDGRISTQTGEHWDGNVWVFDSRTTFEYDANGHRNLLLIESWENDMWTGQSRYVYTFNDEGQQLSFASESWDGTEWKPDYKFVYTYDADGNEIENRREEWDGTQLVNSGREVFTYDTNGKLVTGASESWENSDWTASPGFISFSLGDFGTIYYYYSFLAYNINVFYKTITDIASENLVASDYKLSQNYPNPFNPSTTIKYSIAQNSFVSLKVYDILGKEVATLVNKEQSSGKYEVNFSGSQLASGIYYYSLKFGNNTITKKMILMK